MASTDRAKIIEEVVVALPPGQQTVVSGVAPTWHQKLTGQVSLLVEEQNSTCPAAVVAGWPVHGFSKGWHWSWQAL